MKMFMVLAIAQKLLMTRNELCALRYALAVFDSQKLLDFLEQLGVTEEEYMHALVRVGAYEVAAAALYRHDDEETRNDYRATVQALDETTQRVAHKLVAGAVASIVHEGADVDYARVLYTNPDTLQNRLNADVLKRYDLWLAHWTTTPAAYGQTMWQYAALGTAADVKAKRATRLGTVQGAGGPCDVNWCYVGYAAKIKAAGKNCKKSQTNEPDTVKYAVIASKLAVKNDLQKITGQLKALGYTVNTFELYK